MNRLTLTLCVALLSISLLATGCTTVIGESVGAVRGGRGSYVELTSLGAEDVRPLGKYGSFEITSIQDDFNGMVPEELKANLSAKFEEELVNAELPAEGSPVCKINVNIFYYEGSGTMGIVLGDVEEVLAYVTLVDGSTGSQIAKGICVGRTTDRTTRGVSTKTEGLARAIVGWIEDRYPEPAE